MGKYVLAISGGVDSVVMLDILSKIPGNELIVAHFDHGIRQDSGIDAIFVAGLAKKYDLPFETKREKLGPDASEDKARLHRYKFLRSIAKKHNAKLVTAHHGDDIVESIAINLLRGTGWRGLAVMDSDVERLMTSLTKLEILEYAKRNKLVWREDSTNAEDKYLRNQIRRKTMRLEEDVRRQLLALWSDQKRIKKQIKDEVKRLVGNGPSYNRHFFIHIDEASAIECLRYITDNRLTHPQLEKLLHAVKTIAHGKNIELGGGVKVKFTTRNFTVELIK
ncbi:tRNA lysidine(34) synthetase TilS [Candidatus Saccharibacteria bacterium]|nr:tRNA lysidine(34) synthetase TilS [Candidatus Saccharibacteria bacterium]